MNTAATVDVPKLRSQLTQISAKAETAFERAFDLQQAGASAQSVDAALAEVNRLQASMRSLREQLDAEAVLH